MEHEYGPNSNAVNELFSFWESRVLMQPDPALERREPSAIEWIRERIAEHVRALTLASNADVSPPSIVLFRSLPTLLERALQTNSVSDTAQSSALGAAQGLLPHTVHLLPGQQRDELHALQRAVQKFTHRVSSKSEHLRAFFERHRVFRFPCEDERTPPSILHGALHWEARWRMQFGNTAKHPSPWAPILALWERGICPFVGRGGSWFLYVHPHDAETKPLPPPQPSHAARWLTRDDESGRGAVLAYHAATPPIVPGPLPPPELH